MATIAAQVTDGIRRIVTKVVDGERKVSCSCCVTECCMYSSEMYRQGYLSFEDLPDEIVFVNTSNQEFPISKTESPESYSIGDVGMTLFYGVEGDGVVLRDDGGGWGYWADFSPPDNLYECLITYFDEESQTSPTWVYKDNFADTYTATYAGVDVPITRTSLCIWSGSVVENNTRYTVTLEFFPYGNGGSPESPTEFVGWHASWAYIALVGQGNDGGLGPKDGFMNVPTGTYTDPVSSGAITISE